ncbi:MAG TPA: glucose 1-dehydrogenase [Candidatus Tectomicrobia bacterium]|nr:glucose 1-dehydrogenase [Candidatus Tectomicrobia bacterium]
MDLSVFGLEGRTAIITGASGGLGKETALALADVGCDVVIAARNRQALEEVAAAVEQRGRRCLAMPTDITRGPEVQRLIERTVERFHRLDILVNNAAIAVERLFVDLTEAEWRRVIDTNLHGTFLCTQAAGRQMIQQGGGRIINIVSVVGLVAVPLLGAYGAAKGGVIQFTRALAAEWARYQITVNALAPGYFISPMNEERFADPEVLQNTVRRIPMKRLATYDDLTPVVIFLASEAAKYMTGQVVVVDGGWTIL